MKSNYTQKLGLAFTLVALFLASCGSNATFSKRYHNRGFNIAWGGGADASPSKPAPKKTKSLVSANEAVATQELQVAESSQSNFTAPLSPVTGAASADIAVVPNHIIYVQPVAHAAKTTQIAKATLTSISHRNADAKVMTQSKAVLKKQKKAAASGPGKSQIVALILCILVGPLGIHRFYLGYPLEGVLMLLTGGGCGIWWIIDLIRIVTGDLQPFDGEYTETL
jgi:TM2 domain-containing membrane protein YozV